jgi:hypothetical protein
MHNDQQQVSQRREPEYDQAKQRWLLQVERLSRVELCETERFLFVIWVAPFQVDDLRTDSEAGGESRNSATAAQIKARAQDFVSRNDAVGAALQARKIERSVEFQADREIVHPGSRVEKLEEELALLDERERDNDSAARRGSRVVWFAGGL